MIIRLAKAADIPGMLELLRQVGDVHHRIRPDIFRAGALKYDEPSLRELLRQEDRPIFIAEQDGAVAGYCFCVRKDFRGSSVQADRVEFYIDDLCVEEALRGTGIAKALFAHVKAYAKERGYHSVTLNVWCGNHNAMAFYEKQGLKMRNIMMELRLEDEECC